MHELAALADRIRGKDVGRELAGSWGAAALRGLLLGGLFVVLTSIYLPPEIARRDVDLAEPTGKLLTGAAIALLATPSLKGLQRGGLLGLYAVVVLYVGIVLSYSVSLTPESPAVIGILLTCTVLGVLGPYLVAKRCHKAAYLDGIDFSGQNLAGTHFHRISLRNCRFDDADLTDATFTYCDLHGATFTGAKLETTEFYVVYFEPEDEARLGNELAKWGRIAEPKAEHR